MNKEFVCLSIGDKYDKVMSADGAIIEATANGGLIINIGLTDITNAELHALHFEKINLYLSNIEGVIFVTAVIGRHLCFDMPFNAGLYKTFNMTDTYPYGCMVPVIAVDNRTNIICALRAVGLDGEFKRKFFRLCENQLRNKIENYDAKLKSIYARYSPADIVMLSIARNKTEEI